MSTIEQPPQQFNPYGYGPPQPSQPSNGLATGGFVTALIGAIVALIPILGIVSWLVCPVGLVLSIVGLTTASKNGGVGRGLSIAGIALAVGGLLICSLYAAAFSSAVSQTGRTPSTSPSTGTGYSPSNSAPSYSAPAAIPGQFTSGTYEVGTGPGEIAPGKYTAAAGSSSCYYARLSSLDGGSFDNIIDNHVETRGGQVILSVSASDKAVEISGDCTFVKK